MNRLRLLSIRHDVAIENDCRRASETDRLLLAKGGGRLLYRIQERFVLASRASHSARPDGGRQIAHHRIQAVRRASTLLKVPIELGQRLRSQGVTNPSCA